MIFIKVYILAISRPETLKTHNPSLKAHSNQKTTHSTPYKHTKKQSISYYLIESKKDEELIQSFVSNKKLVSISLIPQFLLNTQIFLDIQHIHFIYKSILDDTWIVYRFFQQFLQEIEKSSEKHGIEVIMNNFITIISYKSMKTLEIIKIYISNANSWYDIESIICYL